MKYFETRFGGGVASEKIVVAPDLEPLWLALFDTAADDLVFDLDTPASALPKLDAAINRLNHDPDSVRHLLPAGANGGLVRRRRVLEQMRRTLADNADASISGPLED
ncbi:hypothetical protein [Nocardia otitidiscaviarum]|uniref:hypothetical protein n=1 Tax=Nocardia otitidiscaviarum TaxID=1823 RepID=UPI002458A7A9|nr:hypothetical protein [Nocardia otitidiscaviarum]